MPMGVSWEATVHPSLMDARHSVLRWSLLTATGIRRLLATTATTTTDAGWATTALPCTRPTTTAKTPATHHVPKLAKAIKCLAPMVLTSMVVTMEATAWTLNIQHTTELLVPSFVPPFATGKLK